MATPLTPAWLIECKELSIVAQRLLLLPPQVSEQLIEQQTHPIPHAPGAPIPHTHPL